MALIEVFHIDYIIDIQMYNNNGELGDLFVNTVTALAYRRQLTIASTVLFAVFFGYKSIV